jgi:uncharacterized membrane protein YeaQ/YmgE (transglycosylase-associated protein family)
MLRILLGVIAGFVAWSIMWVGSNEVLALWIGWYGAEQLAFEKALTNQDQFSASIAFLSINVIRSVIISLLAGFLTAFVANENRKSTAILGVLLLAFGLMVEITAWKYIAIWYHIVFLTLLIPLTIIGGRLTTVSPNRTIA